ncbi:DUF3265 domain-containing protein [Vibrio alginolyticus]|nr:DUF3265 domain-containing protein [Vibrio alginolyticus]MBS9985576.1 DUF3265 domain-containing protein [Vibrio alginolyticus]
MIRHAWHFCYALGLAFKVVCGGLFIHIFGSPSFR